MSQHKPFIRINCLSPVLPYSDSKLTLAPLPLHPFVLADCCLFGLCSLEDIVHVSIDLFSQQLLINYVIPSPDWPFLYPRSACCSGHGEYITVLTKVSHRASLRFSCWWLSGEGDKVTNLDSPGSRRGPGQVVQGGSSSFFWLSCPLGLLSKTLLGGRSHDWNVIIENPVRTYKSGSWVKEKWDFRKWIIIVRLQLCKSVSSS